MPLRYLNRDDGMVTLHNPDGVELRLDGERYTFPAYTLTTDVFARLRAENPAIEFVEERDVHERQERLRHPGDGGQ